MSMQRVLGGILVIVGAWTLWGGYHAVDIIVSRGSSLTDALLHPPSSILRVTSALVLLLGGLGIVLGLRVGRWLALAGIILFALLPIGMVLSDADSTLWRQEAMIAVALCVLFAGLLLTKRS